MNIIKFPVPYRPGSVAPERCVARRHVVASPDTLIGRDLRRRYPVARWRASWSMPGLSADPTTGLLAAIATLLSALLIGGIGATVPALGVAACGVAAASLKRRHALMLITGLALLVWLFGPN